MNDKLWILEDLTKFTAAVQGYEVNEIDKTKSTHTFS